MCSGCCNYECSVFACISTKYTSKKNEGGKSDLLFVSTCICPFLKYTTKRLKKLLTYAIETSNVIAVSVGGILK